jgi:hypothetical protein
MDGGRLLFALLICFVCEICLSKVRDITGKCKSAGTRMVLLEWD